MGTYPISVVGETFANKDGSDRQAEIRRCRRGETVMLIREPDNPHDSNCVKVISPRGVQIGNIARDSAVWIAERMDDGRDVHARILSIGAGVGGRFGVVIEVCTEVEWPETIRPGLLARLFRVR